MSYVLRVAFGKPPDRKIITSAYERNPYLRNVNRSRVTESLYVFVGFYQDDWGPVRVQPQGRSPDLTGVP